MTPTWKTKKTILKHFLGDECRLAYLKRIAAGTDEYVLQMLETFAADVWHEAYIKVEYGDIALDAVRRYADARIHEIRSEEEN